MYHKVRTYLLAGTIAALMLLPACTPDPPTDPPSSSHSTEPTGFGTGAGWVKIGENTYFNNHKGQPILGWLEMDKKTYYMDPDRGGAMATGWYTIADKIYHFREDGVMSTGWVETQEGNRYLLPDGRLAVGMQTVEGRPYGFGPDGAPLTGWQDIDGQTYYLRPDGSAVRGKKIIAGRTCYFTSTGAQILLVNPWNPLPADYSVALEYFMGNEDCYLATVCADALRQMWAGCEAAGHKLHYCSGYRTQETQERYFKSWCNYLMRQGMDYDEAVEATKKEVAYPGTSEHQLGLAVDLTDYDYRELDERQSKTETQKWLMEHCWDYGFILRYPEGSTESTGIIYEPWHYRYVGPELAQEIRALELTLEEYLDMLTEQEEAYA